MLLLIYFTFLIFIFYWQVKNVKAGKSTKGKTIGKYAVYAIAPVFLYGTVFFALVGLEEITNSTIISEGYARSLLFVFGGGVAIVFLTTLVFSLVIFAVKQGDKDAI